MSQVSFLTSSDPFQTASKRRFDGENTAVITCIPIAPFSHASTQ
jgi:hypothetical protein